MPAFSTHYIFTKEMMPKLHELADFELSENAVYIGAQGPDLFFFHRALPQWKGKSRKDIGTALHNGKFGEMLDLMRDYGNSASPAPDIAKSYAYGLILHYALDSICHPYVYYLQNKICEKNPKEHPFSAHNMVELGLDSLLLHERLGIENPKAFETADTFNFTEEEKAEIGRTVKSMQPAIPDCPFEAQDAEQAIEDMKKAQRILVDADDKKKKRFGLLERILAPATKNFKVTVFMRPGDLEMQKKYVNINNGKWESPYEPGERRESFYDLFEAAKPKAEEIIRGFNAGTGGYELTHNLSFLTGVEVK